MTRSGQCQPSYSRQLESPSLQDPSHTSSSSPGGEVGRRRRCQRAGPCVACGLTVPEVVSRTPFNCCLPGQSWLAWCLATPRCPWFPPRPGTRRARGGLFVPKPSTEPDCQGHRMLDLGRVSAVVHQRLCLVVVGVTHLVTRHQPNQPVTDSCHGRGCFESSSQWRSRTTSIVPHGDMAEVQSAMILASSTTDRIAAVGTLIAALAAIGAFAIALVLLIPQWRDFNAKRKDRHKRDARLITVYARARETAADSRVLVVCNRSEQPMYKCLLWLITPSKDARDKSKPPFALPVSKWVAVIPPRQDTPYELKSTRNKPRPLRVPPVEMVFYDGDQDSSWWRDESGLLHELDPDQVHNYNGIYSTLVQQYRDAPTQESDKPAGDD